MRKREMQIGDGLGMLALLVWMSVSVGPWWLGVAIVAGAFVVNFFTR